MPSDEVRDRINSLTGTALDSVLTDVKRRIGDQLTEISGLNTRAAAGLTSGSILTALTGLQTAHPEVGASTAIQILFIFALVGYAVVVVTAAGAYWPRDFPTGLDPAKMVMTYVRPPAPGQGTPVQGGQVPPAPAVEDDIRRRLANDLVDAFDTNEQSIGSKLIWTWGVFVGVVTEAVLLAVITAIHLFSGRGGS